MQVSHSKVFDMGQIERWMHLAGVALRDRRMEDHVKLELQGRDMAVRDKVKKLIRHEWNERRKNRVAIKRAVG